MIERFVARLADFDPAFALGVGDLSRPARLPPGRGGFALERVAELQALAAEAKAATLEGEAKIDVEHFLHCVALESFVQVELGERLANPDVLSAFGDWVLTTLVAPYDSEADRFDRLATLVDALPYYLAEAATTFGEPDPEWHASAVDIARATPPLFDALVDVARGRASPAQADAFKRSCTRARAAVEDFTKTLAGLRLGPVRRVLGGDRFGQLIRLKRIPYDLSEISEIADERVRKLTEKRRDLCVKLSGYSDHKQALRGLMLDRPGTFEQALAEVRSLCREARDFVEERGLAEIPSGEELVVAETPMFARPLVPFAVMMTPKPLWPLQRSIYYMTRADGHRAELHNTVTHEAYPGHHLQRTISNRAGSLWRNAPWTSGRQARMGVDSTGGWAHYGEALMKGQGFYASLADELQATNDSLWRAIRVELDVALSTGTITMDRAAQRLVDDVGLSAGAAMGEIRRAVRSPGHELCYTIGKHLIRELRKEAERKSGFTITKFHHLIMTNGSAPLVVARERQALG